VPQLFSVRRSNAINFLPSHRQKPDPISAFL
jgi:hypothetical protein